MIRTVIAAALALVVMVSAADAAQRHRTAACIETGSVMRPVCGMGRSAAVSSNPFAGVRSIHVTLHRERAYHRRDRGRRPAVRPMSDALKAVIRTSAGRAAGIIRSASGATAHVAARAAGAFQCLVDALDRQGYPIHFMGGWRAHGSVRASLHPAGLALDINQLRRNVTRPRMPRNEIALANACGLISGAQWGWADSGHFQLGGWAGRKRHYAMHRHHRRKHYASAP
ncbi:MAG: hypothetical protein J0H40_17640 [Rhizobiales bacterium]|nr:hypothetical protein [Hyphomicrobiales bacterium]